MNVERFCEKKIKPKAERIDHDPRALKKGFRRLGRKKLLAVRAPVEYGGHDFNLEETFAFTELLQSYSGALGFLQRQHQAAAKFISSWASETFKAEWLPRMAKGKRSVGVSVSHLRSPETPRIIGKPSGEGYQLTGRIPWVSGYRLFDSLVVGFFIPEREEEGMALIRFQKSRTLKISKPLQTIALSSLQTVSLEFENHFVPEDQIFSLRPLGSYQKGRSLLEVHFVNLSALALGLKREYDGEQTDHFHKLSQEYENCRREFLEREEGQNLTPIYTRMLKIATQFCDLVRFMKGTRAVICPNSIERRYRELMLFGVIALDPEIIQTLLLGPSSR